MAQFGGWLNLEKTCELRRVEIETGREIAERVKPRQTAAEAKTAGAE